VSLGGDVQADADQVQHLNELDRGGRDAERPARTSALLATGAALLAVPFLPWPGHAALGGLGAGLLAAGSLAGEKRPVHLGATLAAFAALFAGVGGAGALHTVVPTLLTLVAWDVGRYGIRLGRQLGPDADTRRAELVHAASTTLVGVCGAALALATFSLVAGAVPTLAAVACLLGATLLLVSFA